MRLGRKTYNISAGDLKDRLTLLMPTAVSNGRGGSNVTYSQYGGVWCKASNAGNSRTLAEAQLTFYDAQKFTIRYNELIKADWQITFNGRTYTIHTILNIENRYQYLEILAYSSQL